MQLKSIIVLTLGVAFLLGFGYSPPAHAQFTNEPFFLQEIPKFSLANDSLLKSISPSTDFGYALKIFREDVSEAFTFDPEKKAELKLKHAQERQDEINQLDFSGNQIPLEIEERRIQKLNEARILIENRENTMLSNTFDSLREMGELNDIRILYSQLPRVVDADELTKIKYNEKVNSLNTWRNNCDGAFSVDEMKPLGQAVQKIEKQCPKLVELQEKFGYERLKILVSGTV